jgi:hypothetical protein
MNKWNRTIQQKFSKLQVKEAIKQKIDFESKANKFSIQTNFKNKEN